MDDVTRKIFQSSIEITNGIYIQDLLPVVMFMEHLKHFVLLDNLTQ